MLNNFTSGSNCTGNPQTGGSCTVYRCNGVGTCAVTNVADNTTCGASACSSLSLSLSLSLSRSNCLLSYCIGTTCAYSVCSVGACVQKSQNSGQTCTYASTGGNACLSTVGTCSGTTCSPGNQPSGLSCNGTGSGKFCIICGIRVFILCIIPH